MLHTPSGLIGRIEGLCTTSDITSVKLVVSAEIACTAGFTIARPIRRRGPVFKVFLRLMEGWNMGTGERATDGL